MISRESSLNMLFKSHLNMDHHWSTCAIHASCLHVAYTVDHTLAGLGGPLMISGGGAEEIF